MLLRFPFEPILVIRKVTYDVFDGMVRHLHKRCWTIVRLIILTSF